jgi:predicted Zn-dependent protease
MKLSDHEIKQFAQAQERSRANDLPGTLEILKDLASGRPDSAMINATLANTLKGAGDIAPAIEHFLKAVKLAPTSELYSPWDCFTSCGHRDGETKPSTR